MVNALLRSQVSMAATHFTSACFTQFFKESEPSACAIFSTSFLPTFHAPNVASSVPWNTRRNRGCGMSIKAEETKNRNMTRQMGGQWLSTATRHVRIYAAYIDPVTEAFDQTQTDKLTMILDPTNEFIWPEDKCQKVYDYFSELVDHYEGAPLNEYTLRLIGSDVEHYIRKMLLAGEIKYNLDARVLNFSMGKPRINMEEVEASTTEDAK
uniref:NAD(P)H-quinone oxidoreductase subunit M, chloroplastic n=1 Tax=Wollemia nobilis TaxID=56998 RepID=A0A0C9QWR8_9CONI